MIELYKKLTKKKEIRFLIVGGLNTIFGYAIYALLLYLNINYLVANAIATVIGVIHSYLWNRFYTFKSHDKALGEIVRFSAVYGVSFTIGTCTLYMFKSIFHINEYIAGLCNLVITTLISYFGHNLFSFKKNGDKK